MGDSSGSDDFLGRMFASLEEDGECIAIRYGEVTRNGVRWHLRSHDRYDGVGGLVHVIRSLNGRVLGDLPELSSRSRPPSPLGLQRAMTELWNGPGARWRRLPQGRAPQLVVHHRRPAHAWAVLDRERVTALRVSGTASGASVGGYLLSCLNAALAPVVSHEDGPALWVVPVNMRGAVRRRRALANHVSFVPVRLRDHDGPRAATRQVRARLDDGSHWLFHFAGQASTTLDLFVPSVTKFADHLRGRSIGLFSNLGTWQIGGLDEETTWVLCPPVTRFLPLSAGVIVVNGALGLTLQAYPSLTMQDDEVRYWLDTWIDNLDRQIDSRD